MSHINAEFLDFIRQDLPAHLQLEDFLRYSQRPLRRSIRVNTLKISVADFQALMQTKGWQFESIPWCENGFWISGQQDDELGNSIAHLQGLFYIQEASSMLPPTALFSQQEAHSPFETILDVASAPGSKTTQIAALMQNKGLLVANEYSSSRVKVLHANLSRMGVSNTAITHFDGRVFGEYLYESFDAVQLDAPCGGEGTVRKDPDALKHWRLDDVLTIAETQKDLIESAFLALKPGGVMIYSTCTLNTLENQKVCHHLQQTYPDAVEFISLRDLFPGAEQATTAEGFLHVWPQIFDSEGFFVAAIRKTNSVPRQQPTPKASKNFPFTGISHKNYDELKTYLAKLGLNCPEKARLWQRDNEFWCFPEGMDTFIGKMRYQRIGIKLADLEKHGFKVRHEAAMSLDAIELASNHTALELDPEQAQTFLMGRDVPLHPAQVLAKGEHLAFHQGVILGVGKGMPAKLKNNLPRDLVKDKVTR